MRLIQLLCVLGGIIVFSLEKKALIKNQKEIETKIKIQEENNRLRSHLDSIQTEIKTLKQELAQRVPLSIAITINLLWFSPAKMKLTYTKLVLRNTSRKYKK